MTPTRVGLHSLASHLHMTVGVMASQMTAREYGDWIAWFDLQHAEQAKHDAQAAQQRPNGGGMSFDLTNPAGVAGLANAFKPGAS